MPLNRLCHIGAMLSLAVCHSIGIFSVLVASLIGFKHRCITPLCCGELEVLSAAPVFHPCVHSCARAATKQPSAEAEQSALPV